MIPSLASAIQFKAICKLCDKQMLCVKCHEPLQGSVLPPPHINSKSAMLSCSQCSSTYSWTKDSADNSISITWKNKLIACSGCKGYFKVVKKVNASTIQTTLKTTSIHVLLRET